MVELGWALDFVGWSSDGLCFQPDPELVQSLKFAVQELSS